MAPDVVVALIGLVGVGVSGAVGYAIAERKHRAEHAVDRGVAELLRELLTAARWKTRTFAALQKHCKGLADDELRRALISIGAICLESKSGEELWGLLDRVRDQLSGGVSPPEIDFSPPAQG
jgi:hypothetical protein